MPSIYDSTKKITEFPNRYSSPYGNDLVVPVYSSVPITGTAKGECLPCVVCEKRESFLDSYSSIAARETKTTIETNYPEWYWIGSVDSNWNNANNWNSRQDGSGVTPAFAPWIDGYANYSYLYDAGNGVPCEINDDVYIVGLGGARCSMQTIINNGFIESGKFNFSTFVNNNYAQDINAYGTSIENNAMFVSVTIETQNTINNGNMFNVVVNSQSVSNIGSISQQNDQQSNTIHCTTLNNSGSIAWTTITAQQCTSSGDLGFSVHAEIANMTLDSGGSISGWATDPSTFSGSVFTNNGTIGTNAVINYTSLINNNIINAGSATTTISVSDISNNGQIIPADYNGLSLSWTGEFIQNGDVLGGGFSGNLLTNNEDIQGGSFTTSLLRNNGTLSNGTYNGGTINNYGSINDGGYSQLVNNYGTINGGTFSYNTLENESTINGGLFTGLNYTNYGTINGGTWWSHMDNYGGITYAEITDDWYSGRTASITNYGVIVNASVMATGDKINLFQILGGIWLRDGAPIFGSWPVNFYNLGYIYYYGISLYAQTPYGTLPYTGIWDGVYWLGGEYLPYIP